MKGDPRIEGKCSICPHVVRPGEPRRTRGHVKVTTTEARLKNAMRLHFMTAHRDLSLREQVLLIDAACESALEEMEAGPGTREHDGGVVPGPSGRTPLRPPAGARASDGAVTPTDVPSHKSVADIATT